jgi:diguanylate cyclase (GGDEF)-like protein
MDEPKALKFANQIKQYVEDIKIIHEKNSTSQYITISLGLIIVEPSCDCSVDDLYKAADTALYDAKDNGRNRVSVGIC